MRYIAKNIDSEKALAAIKEEIQYQKAQTEMNIAKEQAYLKGYTQGLEFAKGIFTCSNYEKTDGKGGADNG